MLQALLQKDAAVLITLSSLLHCLLLLSDINCNQQLRACVLLQARLQVLQECAAKSHTVVSSTLLAVTVRILHLSICVLLQAPLQNYAAVLRDKAAQIVCCYCAMVN